MEPLTGFFILEAITFGIIGTILMISGVIHSIVQKNSFNDLMKNISDRESDLLFFLSQNKRLMEFAKKVKKEKNVKKLKKLESAIKNFNETETTLDELWIDEITMTLIKNVLDNEEEKIHNIDRIYTAIPFLIGGFVLQGIGVVLQLT